MIGWRRDGGQLVAELTQQEAAVLRGMVSQIKEMLEERADEAPQDELALITGIRTGPSTPPDNRIVARLLPDFHRGDEDGDLPPADADSAAALRSIYEPQLLEAKTGVAEVVLTTCPRDGGVAALSEEQAEAWLSAINDVRLALGTALDISEDTPEEPLEGETDDTRSAHMGVYQWLTWVQDTLIATLSGDDEE
ncbi:DUF2017 domain-containing protein [Crossiella cryophila]|uniref:DUF2017 domain-containing protein n=1 Tax=Crossiella cryophila TaxID=43355 RepID=A0A7W7CJN3_9PSEU|nr:DUF2017 domain-containing protein [Crossiella cryophila]MBB4682380.1 hypothetical protein [Crossiella cryophila]